jgi:hypothetical protein
VPPEEPRRRYSTSGRIGHRQLVVATGRERLGDRGQHRRVTADPASAVDQDDAGPLFTRPGAVEPEDEVAPGGPAVP